MKLQYTCDMKESNYYNPYLRECEIYYLIELYHDGSLIKSYKVDRYKYGEENKKIKEQGYTFGYSEQEVERARNTYEYLLANIIKKVE